MQSENIIINGFFTILLQAVHSMVYDYSGSNHDEVRSVAFVEAGQDILAGKRKIHMTGIGGVSMSGLAEILHHLGYTVTGSDTHESGFTKKLIQSGVAVKYGHFPENVQGADLVVYTAAVKEDNPELAAARSLGIPTIDRAALLGHIMKQYSRSIAISGTHGKTTTTSMVSLIMLEAGVNPTVHIGGELPAIGGNTRIGGKPYFIAEACEYVESFLKFYPYLAVVLNIDKDHLDYFKDLAHIQKAFRKFLQHVPEEGYIIACGDDTNTLSVTGTLERTILTYGIQSPHVDWKAENIVFNKSGHPAFDIYSGGKFVTRVQLQVPGMHNVLNALAAALTCHTLGIGTDAIQHGLSQFTGTRRRFERKGEYNHITVIDDYAHHPSEIKATLQAASHHTDAKVWCVFQPHTYTRTKALLHEFAVSFGAAHKVIVCDIYAAREEDLGEIHSSRLVEQINLNTGNAEYIPDFNAIAAYLQEHAQPGDMILTMGAGDVYKVGEILLEKDKKAAVS